MTQSIREMIDARRGAEVTSESDFDEFRKAQTLRGQKMIQELKQANSSRNPVSDEALFDAGYSEGDLTDFTPLYNYLKQPTFDGRPLLYTAGNDKATSLADADDKMRYKNRAWNTNGVGGMYTGLLGMTDRSTPEYKEAYQKLADRLNLFSRNLNANTTLADLVLSNSAGEFGPGLDAKGNMGFYKVPITDHIGYVNHLWDGDTIGEDELYTNMKNALSAALDPRIRVHLDKRGELNGKYQLAVAKLLNSLKPGAVAAEPAAPAAPVSNKRTRLRSSGDVMDDEEIAEYLGHPETVDFSHDI